MSTPERTDTGAVIQVRALEKQFGDIAALNGLSFDVNQGELFGFLGPNGAGKTTTISILCGLMKPTAGTAIIAGHDISSELPKVKSKIGYCPQEPSVYKFLTGRENIQLFGELYGMEREDIEARQNALLPQGHLREAINRKAKGYSGGMLRYLSLVMALIHDPEILFLDEPTVGMDARARRSTWDYIRSLKSEKKTIILTTHYIEEAQALCDRVGIIDYGQLIALGTPAELMQKNQAKDLETVFLNLTGRRIAEGS